MLEHLEQQKSLTTNQWKIFAAATIGDMLDFFDFYLIGFVLAFILNGWNLTYGQSGAILLSSGIAAPLGSLFWGWMADKIGRRKVMILTVLNFSVPTGLMALTPDHGWLFLSVCRFFVGLGVTGLYTVDVLIVQEFVPASKRGRITGLTTVLLPAGTLLGALSGAYLEHYVGWRGLFVVGLLPAALTLLIRAWVPESPHWLIGKGRLDEARQLARLGAADRSGADRVAARAATGRASVVDRALQVSAQPGGVLPHRLEPDRLGRRHLVGDDLVRAGAQDQPGRGIVPGDLGRRRRRSSGGCSAPGHRTRWGAAPRSCWWADRGGDRLLARRLLERCLSRRRVGVLPDDPGAADSSAAASTPSSAPIWPRSGRRSCAPAAWA